MVQFCEIVTINLYIKYTIIIFHSKKCHAYTYIKYIVVDVITVYQSQNVTCLSRPTVDHIVSRSVSDDTKDES